MRMGRFIVLEGGEGTGKSTQLALLADHLKAAGIKVIATREPGGTPFAEQVRTRLLDGRHAGEGAEAEAIMINAGRIDHLDTLIRPALANGTWVLCDRFTASTRVYQGVIGGGDADFIGSLCDRAIGPTRPDLTILIDLDPRIAMERLAARQGEGPDDRFDNAGLADHDRIRNAFLQLAGEDDTGYAFVDGALPPADLAGTLARIIRSRFPDDFI